MSQRHGVAQFGEPRHRPHPDARHHRDLGRPGLFYPFVRHRRRRKRNPKQERRRIPQHADKSRHKRSMRVQPLLDDRYRGGRRRHLPSLQVPDANRRNDDETDQLHDRADDGRREELREPSERDARVDHFHQHRAQPDEEGETESALCALIDDRDIHRPHGNTGQVTGHKARHPRNQQRPQFAHDDTGPLPGPGNDSWDESVSSSSSYSISLRIRREICGRTNP